MIYFLCECIIVKGVSLPDCQVSVTVMVDVGEMAVDSSWTTSPDDLT